MVAALVVVMVVVAVAVAAVMVTAEVGRFDYNHHICSVVIWTRKGGGHSLSVLEHVSPPPT